MDVKTKDRILINALDLFSKNGYEAVSVDDIAKAVNIKAPSLYKHYTSKKDILDKLIDKMTEIYEEKSNFKKTDFSNPIVINSIINLTEEDMINNAVRQFKFSLTNELIYKCRKMLTVMQFSDEMIKTIQDNRSYYDILNYYKNIFDILIKNNKIIEKDSETLALEFFSPISMLLFLCDRDIAKIDYAIDLIEKHIHNFYTKLIK